MKKIINIKYRSIFKYDDHTESMVYDEIGYCLTNGKEKQIIFTNQNTPMEIHIKENVIILKNNTSVLHLVKDQKIVNGYQTEYGVMELTTYLVSFEDNDSIKIKYQIWDQDVWVSDVYLLIQIRVLEN